MIAKMKRKNEQKLASPVTMKTIPKAKHGIV